MIFSVSNQVRKPAIVRHALMFNYSISRVHFTSKNMIVVLVRPIKLTGHYNIRIAIYNYNSFSF